MIIEGSIIKVVDGTGVLEVKCVKVLKKPTLSYAEMGDLIRVVVHRYSLEVGLLRNVKKKHRFKKGKKLYAMVVRAKVSYFRRVGLSLNFVDNAVILVNKKKVPLSNRIKGPILLELLDKYPALSAAVSYVI